MGAWGLRGDRFEGLIRGRPLVTGGSRGCWRGAICRHAIGIILRLLLFNFCCKRSMRRLLA